VHLRQRPGQASIRVEADNPVPALLQGGRDGVDSLRRIGEIERQLRILAQQFAILKTKPLVNMSIPPAHKAGRRGGVRATPDNVATRAFVYNRWTKIGNR
jgi:hypothetical protein